MNEPICECGHNIDCHYSAGCLRYEDDIDADQCKCPQFTDTRIGTLRAQLAVAMFINDAWWEFIERPIEESTFTDEEEKE